MDHLTQVHNITILQMNGDGGNTGKEKDVTRLYNETFPIVTYMPWNIDKTE